MGCTPSRSDIVKNPETKLMDKRITLVDQGGEGFSFPLLIKGSSSYDTEGIRQEEAQFKVHFFKNLSNEEKDVNFYSSSEDPLLSELDQEEKEIEKIVSDTEIAISESMKLNKDKHMAEAIMIKKQKSCESEKADATMGDKSESNKNQKPKNGKKQRNRQGKPGRPCKIKEKSSPSVGQPEKKVDFPDALVKAHQNAYAYLNPNIAKYEAMLCMTDQVTETQLIVQQLVNFLLTRFDGINHLLEEITEDGEDLLKEVGENLVWPAGKENPKEQPDLLQQLLQYTVNKMQLLNGTVASLASEVLQESCNFLQSASTSLEEKMKAKQHLDERLVRIIKNLEESAVGFSHHYLDDMTLYSEDSGIGIDNESVKDLNIIDRHGMEINCETIHKCPCNSRDGISMSHDCVLEKQLKNISYSPPQTRNVISSSEVVSKSRSAFLQHQNILKTFNSGHCNVTQESNSFKQNELGSISSTNEDSSANSLTEEECDSISLSEKEKNALSKRSISFPAARENRQKSSTKQIDSADNEIILKMKDAISEKIKFVPAKCQQRAWMEDENGKEFPRPSTASGGQKTQVKQKRSRSEVSLRSHAEDPTLLELQRTQKDLDRRLELFYQLNGKEEINDTLEILNPKELSDLEYFEHVTHRTSTNKLKASLAKNFNILPDPSCRYNEDVKCKKSITTGMSSKDLTAKKENSSGTPKPNTPYKSVKKLIETFSPSENLVKPSSLRTLGPIKCVRKFGLQSISPNLLLPKGFVPLNHKYKVSPLEDTSCKNIRTRHCTLSDNSSMELANGHDTNEDSSEIDIESLPPPPPEMLMEILHESTESSGDIKMEESYLEVADKTARADEQSTTKKITQISPRMKLSLCSLDLLPNKNLSNSSAVNKAPNNGVDTIPNKYFLELNATHMSDCRKREDEMEKVADLYKQSHKIIPLTNPKETSEPNWSKLGNMSNSEAPLPEKQNSPDLLKKNEKTSSFISRVSPVRKPPSSPPNQKRFPSPPLNYRAIHQVSTPILHQQPSLSTHSRSTSPPVQRKVISPLPQQNLSNPPVIRKQQSSQNQKVSNLPCHDQEASPPPFATTPSPSISPSQFHRCLQNNMDSKEEPHSASPKIVSNAHSIFCLATSSLFEAKPVVSSNINPMGEAMAQPEVATSVRRNSMQLRQLVDQQRTINSAASPQPCLRRSFSDHRPGFQLPLPVFVTAESDPVLNRARLYFFIFFAAWKMAF
ncbi:photoreceptor cilium actin regulator isoform X2 [Crotalus tigris]|uniref:photoreceptor cilium actin regulator isoform X2 n=1 Tax=Crotalus tigris TaxID=88082 RepID=UPI00192F3581|nr:photoreceptor cilium actin regulator isoform X2 [Crotalus tigris]